MDIIRHIKSALIALTAAVLTSCGGSGSADTPGGDTIAMKYTTHLTMVDHGDFVKADFRNPWDTTRILQTYLLVPADAPLPDNLPKGTVVRTPLERSVVYTSVHGSLIDELGRIDAIAGVCDPQYIMCPEIKARIADGRIADCGSTFTPNIERILMLKPDAILLSAYENSNDHNKVDQIGIPIIDCIDYMESSPLARAEWMRFFGRLYGEGARADSIFAATEKAYLDIKRAAAGVDSRPTVLTELIYGESWAVPGALSTAGRMIEDAGGRNPFDSYKQTGSVQLAPEKVLFEAKDADIWLIKYSQATPMTLRQLAADKPIYGKFRAYETGNVYGINTTESMYFDEAAFHPHWVLAEYIQLFHPELVFEAPNHHYYTRLEP